MTLTFYHCPFCPGALTADTTSGEEFSCAACGAMVDILDADLAMVSRPPHADVTIMRTRDLIRGRATLSVR